MRSCILHYSTADGDEPGPSGRSAGCRGRQVTTATSLGDCCPVSDAAVQPPAVLLAAAPEGLLLSRAQRRVSKSLRAARASACLAAPQLTARGTRPAGLPPDENDDPWDGWSGDSEELARTHSQKLSEYRRKYSDAMESRCEFSSERSAPR